MYFHITIREDHHHYLRFALNNSRFQFTALPFGLLTAPRVFTKCLAPVAAYLRTQGIAVFPYLDDWLLAAPSRSKIASATRLTLNLFNHLGLQVNWERSLLTPTQSIQHIDALLDSKKVRAFLPPDHIPKFKSLISILSSPFGISTRCSTSSRFDGIHHFGDITCVSKNEISSSMVSVTIQPSIGQPKQTAVGHTRACPTTHLVDKMPQSPNRQAISSTASHRADHYRCQSHGMGCLHSLWSPAEKTMHINLLELLAIFKVC